MSGSLRDQLEAAVTQAEEATQQAPATSGAEEVSTPSEESTQPDSQPAEVATEKAGRTAGRARDEKGRLLPGAAQREPQEAIPQPAASVAAPKPLQRPSTLKKELWPVWDKLTKGETLTAEEARQKAEWILQRDADYAKGVSTYKAEADHAKPIIEAIAPFLPALQANNVQPDRWISQLGSAHQALVYGNPQQKLAMFAKMAQDYQVDLSGLFVKGEDGGVYINPQLQQARQQRAEQSPDVRKLVQDALSEERARSEVERMKSDTEKYPHFEAVRNTMVGLLQSRLATDYDAAYQAAIRLPQHSDIFEAMQQQQRQAEELKAAEDRRKAAEAARRNAISPRTSTPTAAAAGLNGKKGLRDHLSENFDAAVGGRV